MNIPLGIESFAKMREGDYYYVDKTGFISELLRKQFEANLITRPRRFGKSLAMSMLEDFFDISRDSASHFEGLEISGETELCGEWMNKWPVVSITLKDVEGLDFKGAFGMLKTIIYELCLKYTFLGESGSVTPADKISFENLLYRKGDDDTVKDALLLLTRMMAHHYGKPVILLIDEYDVPLAKASENGYYTEMMSVVRTLLGRALKTNPDLKFAVITGCLRISKESIFTGLNNLVTDSIADDRFSEHFGFTPSEVEKLLNDFDLSDRMTEVKRWYDGYRFGHVETYCPWSVLNYVSDLRDRRTAKPKNYWVNTSHNGIIYSFIGRTDLYVNDKFETLMAGGSIAARLEENLTYDTIGSSEENLWSLLYLTGYLTGAGDASASEDGMTLLRIPNEEVKSAFAKTITDCFRDSLTTESRQELFHALWSGDAEGAGEIVSNLLFNTISYFDYKESYYHAFLTGIFTGCGVGVESNYECGTGRPDIVIKDRRNRRAMVLEIKRAKTEDDIPRKTAEALKQFAEEKYLDGIEKGFRTRLGYAVVFHDKDCRMAEFRG